MGACASKPKDFDKELAPAPEPATPKKTEQETPVPASQEKKDGEEAKKEEPSVDVSAPASEAPKIDEVTAATAPAAAEEVKPAKEEEKKTEEVKPEEKKVAEEAPKPAAQ
ncbi:putative UNC93-like protein 1-like [Capsicum annuum]|uniref:Putative serine/threonine-protein kinase n=1 Tax=Capsicum annuum TaxID=4072 RepID=A0A0U2Q299_CAPAN|nr:major latex allergen Hev b 5-like [Capsicum annuum]ALS87702.1 putative serine/threonine-protein kinase [Capsicum annuum]KAF3658686.1 putative UNC93-like protein 1-like [Capsicum annuum]